MRDIVRGTFVDLVALLAGTARAVWRHWPVLLAVAFTGIGIHQAVRAAAATVSETDGTLGFVVLIAAPLAMLSALIVMLRVASGPGRARLVGHVGGLLVPFLAAYEAQGDLQDVVSDYAYHAWLHGSKDAVPARVTVTMAVVVPAAMVARRLLVLAERRFSHRWAWLGFPAAYLEMLSLTVIGLAVLAVTDLGTGWLGQRRVTALGQEWWSTALDRFGPVKAVLGPVQSWLGTFLGAATTVLVHPLTWLAVAAIALGELRGPDGGDDAAGKAGGHDDAAVPPEPGEEQATTSVTTEAAQVARSADRILVDRGEAFVRASLSDRFGPLYRAFQQARRTGLAAVLTFCLVFLAARAAQRGLWELERLVIGPADLGHGGWFESSAILGDVNEAVTLMLTTCVLAVAAPVLLHRPRHSARRVAPQEPDPWGEPGFEPRVAQDAVEGTVSAR